MSFQNTDGTQVLAGGQSKASTTSSDRNPGATFTGYINSAITEILAARAQVSNTDNPNMIVHANGRTAAVEEALDLCSRLLDVAARLHLT